MRFMVLHEVDATMEAGERPAQRVIEEMGKLVGRSIKAGIFKDGAGLQGHRWQRRWIDAPFTESKELVAGFSILAILGDNEVDVREVAS